MIEYAGVIFITVYMMLKVMLWWLVFGTARVITGRYSGRMWRNYTLWGLLIMGAVIAFDCYIGFCQPGKDTMVYCGCWVLCWVGMVVAFREMVTLFGLLVGDWHPMHPKLRFWGFGSLFKYTESNDDNKIWKYYDPAEPNGYYSRLPLP